MILNAYSDLQDVNTWHAIVNTIVANHRGSAADNAATLPDHTVLDTALTAGLDTQRMGMITSALCQNKDAPATITNLFLGSPAKAKLNIPLGAVLFPPENCWLHVAEINWWGRLANVDADVANSTIWFDERPRKYGGTAIPLQVGWHVDKMRTFMYTLDGMLDLVNTYRFFNGKPARQMRIFGPRCIKEPTDRIWYPKPRNTISGGAARPAYPGMRAIRPHGQYRFQDNSFGVAQPHPAGPWYQDLHVYEFNGLKWLPKSEVHGKATEPDMLDSQSADPNFQFFDFDVARDARAYQQFYMYQTLNSIMEP